MHKWRRRGWRPDRRTQRFYFFKEVSKLAAEVMAARGLPLDVTTQQQWEQGRHQPRGLVGEGGDRFPDIADAQVYGKSELRVEDLAEIRRL